VCSRLERGCKLAAGIRDAKYASERGACSGLIALMTLRSDVRAFARTGRSTWQQRRLTGHSLDQRRARIDAHKRRKSPRERRFSIPDRRPTLRHARLPGTNDPREK
jgi:hypothetical protein